MNAAADEEAWAAIQGAFDAHVHAGPDVISRRIDDVDLALEFQERGLRGFVLKSHYLPTAERARAVARAVPGIEVAGAIALNHSVGGLNPAALEVSARSGARVAWMPTVDAANEWSNRRPGAPPPAWGEVQASLMARPGYPAPISLLDDRGRLVAAARECLALLAAHDMVLATGHTGREEVRALVLGARAAGIERIVVTHVEFPSLDLSPDEQAELARLGAHLEHCYTTPYTGKTEWARVFAGLRAAGPERCLISTDLGQAANPAVSAGLADFARRLLQAGFSAAEVRTLAVTNPVQLFSLTPARTGG